MNIKNVIVVATHPDDETLGCAGTLLKLKSQGVTLNWLIMTDVVANLNFSSEFVGRRKKEIKKISQIFGFKKTIQLKYLTTQLDQIARGELVGAVSKVFADLRPDTIFLPNRSDIHSDHKETFQAVMSSSKTFRYPFIKNILMYETISETEFAPALPESAFTPNVFVDMSRFLDAKIRAMKIYKSEMGQHPFPRSEDNIRALATFRGATINAKAAEAFMLLKAII